MLVDSHAHLEVLENLQGVLRHAKAAGVDRIITIGTSLASSRQAIEIAEKFSTDELRIYATCGIHPFDGASDVERLGADNAVVELSKIASKSKKVVGIGECGLDYYLDTSDPRSEASKIQATSEKDKEYQRELFGEQVKLADHLNLPLVVHCRNGWDEIFDYLTRGPWKLRSGGVFHSFTGSEHDVGMTISLGFYVSYSGIVTFKNAQEIRLAALDTPSDKILVETDSPYLSPEPFRGQKNEPANVKITSTFLAELKNLNANDFAYQTSKNAKKLFNL